VVASENKPSGAIEVARDFAALESRIEEWNRLVERAQTNTVFQTYECHASWWKVFGADRRLLILLAEADGELIGLAPLMASERSFVGHTQRMVEFIGARSFDYCDFIIDRTRPDVLPLFLSELADGEDAFDQLYLRNIPGSSTTVGELRRFFESSGFLTDIRVLYEAPTRLFNDPAADQQLPNKKSLKRHYNYFRRSGELEFRNCTNAEEVLRYLDGFFEQHIRRRAVTDTPSLFLDERMRSFFRELVRTLAPRGWLLFSVVLFNQKAIAMHFGFEYGNRIIWYKPAFDMDYATHSPGEVLIRYLFEYALQRKVGELDFTIGKEPFKYRFANHTRSNYAVCAFRKWLPYRMNRLLLDARRLVEQSPAFTRIARKALGRWRDQL
jgi:CelD/BcsL family acetyltransferase involved in cellulose biosynthesis